MFYLYGVLPVIIQRSSCMCTLTMTHKDSLFEFSVESLITNLASCGFLCLIKETNFIKILRFRICFVNLGMKYVVLVLILLIRTDLWNALTKLFPIVFELYFLVWNYLLISGLTPLIMYYTFKMLCHIVVKINLLSIVRMTEKTISRI